LYFWSGGSGFIGKIFQILFPGKKVFREKNKDLVISYINLRRLIGVLGISLPFICVIGGYLYSHLPLQQSISFYYHTNMRDFFVGLMIAVSMFLVTYNGYERIDNIVSTISGLAGFGVAFFPCLGDCPYSYPPGIFQISPATSDTIHLVSACTFFLLLTVNSYFLFTLTGGAGATVTKKKIVRNRIYRSCGVVMFVSLVSVAICHFVLSTEEAGKTKIILILETILLVAFGVSWLIKGETFFRD
jgi:hypothetical protein